MLIISFFIDFIRFEARNKDRKKIRDIPNNVETIYFETCKKKLRIKLNSTHTNTSKIQINTGKILSEFKNKINNLSKF